MGSRIAVGAGHCKLNSVNIPGGKVKKTGNRRRQVGNRPPRTPVAARRKLESLAVCATPQVKLGGHVGPGRRAQ